MKLSAEDILRLSRALGGGRHVHADLLSLVLVLAERPFESVIVGGIAKSLNVSIGSASPLVRRGVAAGLVARVHPDDGDGRVTPVTLTPLALQRLQRFKAASRPSTSGTDLVLAAPSAASGQTVRVTKVKWVVRPGEVLSATDGDSHYIGAAKLMQLYNVSPRDCVVDHDGNKSFPAHWPRLYPDPTGVYYAPPIPEGHTR